MKREFVKSAWSENPHYCELRRNTVGYTVLTETGYDKLPEDGVVVGEFWETESGYCPIQNEVYWETNVEFYEKNE